MPHPVPDRNNRRFQPPAPARARWPRWLVALVLLGAAGFGWQWWQNNHKTAAPTPTPQTAAPPAPAAPAPEVAASGPQHPVDTLAPAEPGLPALASSDAKLTEVLNSLLGAKSVTKFLVLDGFVRRVVATVDSLPREHAPTLMWPVQKTAGRFGTQAVAETQVITVDNSARYAPFVAFVEQVDLEKAVALYAGLYPLFQQAYEELGYPGKYFNDRLVAVIDHLLQAPEPTASIQVKLVEVKGDVPSIQPWVRYEYVDPQLQALSAGQKMMVRMGHVHERQLKARLTSLRALLVKGNVTTAVQPAAAASKP
ncbi:DUF3014 domain-containing protein [Variovorax sp. HJSM1_2]|uniref:DUF3014 domain-containing protein n=1 Tax=Variovorax sp. HJSM1_2 TaxID=3366263 RepID=UPI003BDE1784